MAVMLRARVRPSTMRPWKFLLILKMRTTRVRRTTRSSESASTDTDILAWAATGGGVGDCSLEPEAVAGRPVSQSLAQ